MTEQPGVTPSGEDLTLVLVVHGLFIGSLLGFAPAAIVGLIMALVAKEAAGPIARSHYRFQIRTFWIGLLAWALATVAMFWGAVFSVVLIGIPLLIVSGIAVAVVWLWALVRSILGLAWGVQGRPCPRPDSLTA
jgi:uncharacterized membrane protein